MNSKLKLMAGLLAVTGVALVSTGCQRLEARDNLNKGVRAFKAAKFADAVEYFKVATDLDPTLPAARLYLASAYMSQYIPGAESEDNLAMAKQAEDEFMKVLDIDPKSSLALASIATLYFHRKNWDKAEEWNKKLLEVDPNNKEAHYTLGVIAWTRSFSKRMEARAKLGMKPEDPGPVKDKAVRDDLNTQFSAVINSGLDHLGKALEIDAEYDDAMAYMNLLYRERADLQESKEAYQKDIDSADNWVQKTLETKKIKTARAAEGKGGLVEGQ